MKHYFGLSQQEDLLVTVFFGGANVSFRVGNKVSQHNYFSESYQQLSNSADGILFLKVFCGLNFEPKLQNRSICVITCT